MDKRLLEDILKWDVESWSETLFFWEKAVDFSGNVKCLALGECNGGLSLWLALKGCDVICSDFENTEKIASPLHERYNLRDKIKYQDVDAVNMSYENTFDIIIFKSILGCIGKNENRIEQVEVFKQIHKALKPGGKLLFAENMKASPLHVVARNYLTNWGRTWRYPDCDDLNDFLKIYSKYEIYYSGFLTVFGKLKIVKDLFFAMDKIIFNHILPQNWKYIAYGIAEK